MEYLDWHTLCQSGGLRFLDSLGDAEQFTDDASSPTLEPQFDGFVLLPLEPLLPLWGLLPEKLQAQADPIDVGCGESTTRTGLLSLEPFSQPDPELLRTLRLLRGHRFECHEEIRVHPLLRFGKSNLPRLQPRRIGDKALTGRALNLHGRPLRASCR